MSYDVSLHMKIDTGGPELVNYCAADIGNYTSNVSRMWNEALGLPLADLDGETAGDHATRLRLAVDDMTFRVGHYQAMNPANGWGSYDGALDYLTRLRDACIAHPKAVIYISH